MKLPARDSIVDGILACKNMPLQDAQNMSNVVVAQLRQDGYRIVDVDQITTLFSVIDALRRV